MMIEQPCEYKSRKDKLPGSSGNNSASSGSATVSKVPGQSDLESLPHVSKKTKDTSNKCIASSNKCLTSNKKLLETSLIRIN